MRLTERQARVLDSLTRVALARPMDVGGRDQSHHQGTLMQLVRRGLVERRLRGSLLNQIRGQELHDRLAKSKRSRHAPRGSYVYRITRKGRAAFNAAHPAGGKVTPP